MCFGFRERIVNHDPPITSRQLVSMLQQREDARR
jgi:hypothetical protein